MRLLRNIAIFSIIDAAGMAVGVIASPIMTRLLTQEQYGAQPLLMSVWSLATIIQFAGMDSAFIIYSARKNQDRRAVLVTTTIIATIAALLVWLFFSAISLGTGLLQSYAGVTWIELGGFLLWILANTLLAWQLQLLRFMHEATRFARVTLIGRIASVLVALPVMYVLPQEQRLAAMFYTYAAFAGLSLLLALREVRAAGGQPFDSDHYDATLTQPMIILGLALMPGALTYSLCSIVDKLLLGAYSGPGEVAILALASSVASVVIVLKLAFSRAWDPHMVEWLATGDPKKYLPKLQAAVEFIAPSILLVTLLALSWSDTLFAIVFPATYSNASTVMPVLVLSGALSTLCLVAIATETLSGRARYRLPVYFAGLSANIALGISLIPKYGVLGAAYGVLAGEFTILIFWILVGRLLLGNLQIEWGVPAAWASVAISAVLFYHPGSITGAEVAESIIVTICCVVGAWHLVTRTLRKLRDPRSPTTNTI